MNQKKTYITINPQDVTNKLQEIQENSIAQIFFGLQTLENTEVLKPAFELSNGEGFFTYAMGSKSLSLEEKKENYKNWLIKKGIEDLIKGLNLTLLDTCIYGVLHKNMDSIKTGGDYNVVVDREIRNTRKLGIPQLLKRIDGFLLDTLTHKEKILSINQTRNCLIHRNGLVTNMDANNNNNKALKLSYSGFEVLKISEEGGEKEINGPFDTNGGEVKVSVVEKSKSFELGETLNFDYRDFNEINFTFTLFAHELISKLPI